MDRRRAPGRFLLTGSGNLLPMRRVSETLAGRAVYLTLWPLTAGELAGRGSTGSWGELLETPRAQWPDLIASRAALEQAWRDRCLQGGFPTPALHLADPEARQLWFGGYAKTYLERDLAHFASVASMVDFRRLMRATCLRLGNVLNQSELARDLGLALPTVHRHLDLMEASYQLVRLPAFSRNRARRLIKSPKVYGTDVALALHLAGATEPRGEHLENLVLGDLLAWRETVATEAGIHCWRTTTGDEVDLVVEVGGRLLAIEVKASDRLRVETARGLKLFLADHPEAAGGLLLHTGTTRTWLAEGVYATPWWSVM